MEDLPNTSGSHVSALHVVLIDRIGHKVGHEQTHLYGYQNESQKLAPSFHRLILKPIESWYDLLPKSQYVVYYFVLWIELAVRRLPSVLLGNSCISARETYFMSFIQLFQGNRIV
jgi:hypothetical protein